jgi:hypothetical protein
MTSVHKLRLLFERRYAIVAADAPHKAHPLQAFLALPIRERLILLALLDQHGKPDEAAIRAALPYAKQSDVRLTSKTILKAVETLKAAIETPTLWIDPDNNQETQLLNVFYPSAAVCLFGGLVPLELRDFSLQDRLIAYLLVVETMKWDEVEELPGVSEWRVKMTLHRMTEVLA